MRKRAKKKVAWARGSETTRVANALVHEHLIGRKKEEEEEEGEGEG